MSVASKKAVPAAVTIVASVGLEPGMDGANKRYRTATRGAAFLAMASTAEIRMLSREPWKSALQLSAQQKGVLQQLLDKGYLAMSDQGAVQLSPAGVLLVELLVLSGHLVGAEVDLQDNGLDALDTQPGAEAANDRYRQHTRTAAFCLTIGIQEIRGLANQLWTGIHLTASEKATIRRLADKGLLQIEGEQIGLSTAGSLLTKMLKLSQHIVS
jgi:hypothetical protein